MQKTPLHQRLPTKKEGKTLEEAYYTQFGGPFQGGGYRATAPVYYQRNNTNPSYQERRQSMEDTQSKFMSESTKRHKENSNLIKEIRATTDAAIRNQGSSIKTLEIQIGQMSKVLQERGFGSLPSLTETNPRDQVKSISTTIEADSYSICRIGSSQYAVSTGQNSILLYKSRQTTIPFLIRLDNHYCEEEEGNYGQKFTEAYGASHINNTIPRKEKDQGVSLYLALLMMLIVELVDRTVKYQKGIAENVLVRIVLRERIELDLEARLMGETLVLNRSLDPFLEDYIKLNDLNEPFELRRNQGDDLMPTIKEGEVIEEFRTRDEDLDIGIDDYPTYYDNDKKIHIDFLEDIDAYRDEGIGDIIIGEPFFREVRIKVKRFKRVITLYNGDDEISEKDVKNGISHAYQKLKGFYKGVLNLGPNYFGNAKMEEWLTRGHISTHEME
ncbi:hypothetical protein Tco_1392450 [Tanacetum coccineum]